MRFRRPVLAAIAASAIVAASSPAAVYKGRPVDGRWFDGRGVSDDFGAYDCQVRFHADRASVRLINSNLQIEGFLEEEAIGDPHRILLHDPKRGMYWTLDVYNFGY